MRKYAKPDTIMKNIDDNIARYIVHSGIMFAVCAAFARDDITDILPKKPDKGGMPIKDSTPIDNIAASIGFF